MSLTNSTPCCSENDQHHNQNVVVQPLLTDLYQITMAYSYWLSGKQNDVAGFDLYFRKNPFQGEFTIFAGLEECVKYLKKFHFSDSDIEYLRTVLPKHTHPGFFDYLKEMNVNSVTMWAIDEGTVVFPKVPLIMVEGPLPIVQLLETCFLNLVNYASLVATNAVRFRLAAGPDMTLFEFGLRRAQGPDGGMSASRYCYMGGFDGTSNVLAGKLYDIPVQGTHAHAFVNSFINFESLKYRQLKKKDSDEMVDFLELCLKWQDTLSNEFGFLKDQVSEGELAAFCSYAISFPDAFLALIDTYDVVKSGLPNFCAVALALHEIGYIPKGVRLDSGDLAYLSHTSRKMFQVVAEKFNIPMFAKLTIVASNDINEDTIHSLNQQTHQINCYGIGTHLVTCQKQPALGCVFKLVEINGIPRIKLSEEPEKISIPGKKCAYRLFGADDIALVDVLMRDNENPPKAEERVFCRHPFQETKRAYVMPTRVEPLYKVYWKNGKVQQNLPTLREMREKTISSLCHIRQDHKRALQPSPYKVAVSAKLYTFMHNLWLDNAPVGELS
ncbi:pncB [Acanthosepion pharaonis]|uniref:Nicotinate phosphoribosyltransferase n=1 Tax=Acanthosepion pharaonis TaxID=158019 RepID=A0A812CK75_ACAPH|nr:pncB [Sepia pharaonis]